MTAPKFRWKLRKDHKPGHYRFEWPGKAPLVITVDDDSCFETEGPTDYPLYAFARVIYPHDEPRDRPY